MTPTIIKAVKIIKIGWYNSIVAPTSPLAIADIITIKAELTPEAVPPREGTAFTIWVLAIGQIIPVPIVIIVIGRKKAKGLDKKDVKTSIIIAPRTPKKAPKIKNNFIERKLDNLLIIKLPIINPIAGDAKYRPVEIGDSRYSWLATKGPPTKKMPKIEKLKDDTIVGGQNLIDVKRIG